MIDVKNKEKCCGCSACSQKCPKHCIHMIEDEEGFLYPLVDASACVNCGLCEQVCPYVQKPEPNVPQCAYTAKTKNVRLWSDSSSGGAFTEIVNHVTGDQVIVYGAAWDKLKVKHIGIACKDDIGPLRKSKYVQSDTQVIYIDI